MDREKVVLHLIYTLIIYRISLTCDYSIYVSNKNQTSVLCKCAKISPPHQISLASEHVSRCILDAQTGGRKDCGRTGQVAC